MTAREPQFCDECDVLMDLHNGPDSCDFAETKASMLAFLDRLFTPGIHP